MNIRILIVKIGNLNFRQIVYLTIGIYILIVAIKKADWQLSALSLLLSYQGAYPTELKEALGKFVDVYNHQRYHESLQNQTPADVYFGRGELILQERQRIKQQTLKNRKLAYEKIKSQITCTSKLENLASL